MNIGDIVIFKGYNSDLLSAGLVCTGKYSPAFPCMPDSLAGTTNEGLHIVTGGCVYPVIAGEEGRFYDVLRAPVLTVFNGELKQLIF
jgi:hypothetical protein